MPQRQKKHGRPGGAKNRVIIILAVAVVLALSIQPVQALAYYFSVPKLTVDVYVNQDGIVSLDYDYLFQNEPSGEPIQYVDIGMPTTDYDLGSASGTVNGQPVGVEKSTEVKGIALNLGSRAIPSGQSGEVRGHIGTVKGMLFKADAAKTQKSEDYGSFNFEPNTFGSQYVTGSTDMTVTLHLPPGLKPEEPIYFPPTNWPGQSEPESGLDASGNVYYRWHATNASTATAYRFGAAFPARLVPAGALLTPLPQINIDFGALCPWIFCAGFFGFMALTVYGGIVGNRKRKLQYLPPRASVEGNGIKRGLTAVEAALLMEQPMDKILTMILFSVVKKGAATVVSRDPMKIEVTTPQPEDLRAYETAFVQAMAKTSKSDQRKGLQDMMTDLVKSVAEKMRGFSRKETLVYYQDIMKKAWQQVEQAQTPELKMKNFDEAMDWTMLDRNFDNRTQQTFGTGPVILPGWWWRFDPGIGHAAGGSVNTATSAPSMPSIGGSSNRPPGGISMPSLPGSSVAASMVGGMQSFANQVVGDVTAFTGGVTSKTNPPPPPPTRSSGGGFGSGGGGSHCACACACACAGCACACAGGGR
jgi:hypothetical protein